ncbi:hypothetical protein KJ562_01620 [Patescibacteria group bacterium]|nr:hypothetical protein [Patescibacteria group bacterium]MBU4162418.1 hypothetical protein [Patescibacteria group bacterium]
MELPENIFNIIVSPEIQRAFLPIKILAIVFSILLFVAIVYFLFTTSYLRSLYLNDWDDYRYWRKNYGPGAVKGKRRILKQARQEQKEEFPFEEKEKEKEKEEQAIESLETENLRHGRVERTDWERVSDRLESKGELNYKLALIDADKIFVKMMAKYGKELSSESISNFDEIMEAKKVLEKMLDNPKTILTQDRAKELVGIYGKALKEMGETDV